MAGRRTKLTEQMAAKILANLRHSGRLENAAAREGIGRSTVYDWMRRGERKSPGPYYRFAHEVTQFLEERIALAATIHTWLAMGYVMEVPAHYKNGQLRYDANGQQVFKNKVFRPNRKAIEWKLMLLDPKTYRERKDPWGEAASPQTTESEKEAPYKAPNMLDMWRAVQKRDPTLFEPTPPKASLSCPSRRSRSSGRPLGRRSKLTPEIQERIIRYFGACFNITHAALRAGISKATLFEWLQRGKREEEGRYQEFFAAFRLKKAELVAALAVRHQQIAFGGIVPLRMLDRFGRQRYDAMGKPLYRSVLLRPSADALAWELAVDDPETYNLPTRPAKSTRPRKPRRKPELDLVDAFLRDI